MAAFFSGTDSDTLKKEGTDTCHYLSLVVNNAGKYVARVTRRIKESFVGKRIISYPTYGDNIISSEEDYSFDDMETVEYYNLEIDIRDNMQSIRDAIRTRYEELKKKGPTSREESIPNQMSQYVSKIDNRYYGGYESWFKKDEDYLKDYPIVTNNPDKNQIKFPSDDKLSDDEPEINTVDSIEMAAQIIYGNITLTYDNFKKFTKVDSWIRSGMVGTFNKRFHALPNNNKDAVDSFDTFMYTFINMIITDYVDENQEGFDYIYPNFSDEHSFESIVAKAISEEIDKLVDNASASGEFTNPYIESIQDTLKSFM